MSPVRTGWTGQWTASFTPNADGTVTAAAGMEHLNLRLNPGERISQPTVLLGGFSGGRWAGHNALRRTLYECYVPALGGERPVPPVSWNHFFGFGGVNIDEAKMMEAVDSVKSLGIEYFCLDAGWYGVDFWQAGDWRVHPRKFPRGLEPLAEAVREHGMRFGLWFDPERVTEAAYDDFPRKDLLVPARRDSQPNVEFGIKVWLLDLTLPAAEDWIVELIGDYARRLDLRWIRWDMNYPPLEMWLHSHDAEPDRLGLKEIRYIEGLYRALDRIIQNHPRLLIEWCAGGGRRVDLETLRRSHTLWKSDITGAVEYTRPHLTGGNLFLPGTAMNLNLITLESDYDFYSQFGGPLGFGHDFRPDSPEQLTHAIERIREFKELRRFLTEDYYPLFDRHGEEFASDLTVWDGWQFHDPERHDGFLVLFRLPESPDSEATVRLHGLDPSTTYHLSAQPGSGVPSSASGEELSGGITVRLDEPRSAMLVRYSP